MHRMQKTRTNLRNIMGAHGNLTQRPSCWIPWTRSPGSTPLHWERGSGGLNLWERWARSSSLTGARVTQVSLTPRHT